MQPAGIHHVELILLLLLALVAVLAVIAKKVRIAYPIVLMIGGLLLSFVPHVPRISLNPNVFVLVILPPLIFSAAFRTSWRDFRENLITIVMLAFGLVGFTIYGVALTSRWLLPGFDWKQGLVLGSVVAATDAIAATATAKRLGLPRRIVDILEAESLVNDGSGLVALKFTLAMLVTGFTPSITAGILNLLYVVFAAVAIGLVAGMVIHVFQRHIREAPVEITISLLTPYISYLAAESIGCSGVLATIACGLYLGRRSSDFFSLRARMEASAVWTTLDFILNGIVFLLLGLQLPFIRADIETLTPKDLIRDGAWLSLIVIVLRLLWVYPGVWISAHIHRLLWQKEPVPLSSRSIFLLGWAGMRGVLALAAASSLPERLYNGASFPHRNLIIFLTFCVIFATLVIQGLCLPSLIHVLGLAGAEATQEEEQWARRQMFVAALQALESMREHGGSEEAEIYDELDRYYRRQLALLENTSPRERERSEHDLQKRRQIAQQLRDVERSVALRLRAENQIHDGVLRRLERELDLLDARFGESQLDLE
jgi:Na+/H+ antiporter